MASPLTTYISNFLKTYNYHSVKRRSFKEYILTKNFNQINNINAMAFYDLIFYNIPILKKKNIRKPPFFKNFLVPYTTKVDRKLS
jgi:hypothetical protein